MNYKVRAFTSILFVVMGFGSIWAIQGEFPIIEQRIVILLTALILSHLMGKKWYQEQSQS